jgi:hypothetical protein
MRFLRHFELLAGFLRTIVLILAVCCLCAAQERTLWRDPGEIERLDFTHATGPENPPRPPFHFVRERLSGTSPKATVLDSAGVKWRIKGGPEVRAESLATRLVGALGYHVEPTWFVASGKIEGARSLTRAARLIRPDGSFSNASFERRDPNLKPLPEDWAWNNNPFIGTDQLNGLKVLVMLVADWDNKDVRDRRIGSNTGILERRIDGREQLVYAVKDWGQTLGGWGPGLKPNAWNCERFTAQTKTFLQGHKGNYLSFGFTGQHTTDFKNDITIENVRWLMRYLDRITDTQLHSGLKASGATPEEMACLATQLGERIKQLRAVESN